MIATVAGKTPKIEEGVFIADSAQVLGDVYLQKNSSVWYGAVLRGDIAAISVGEGSNIQDNSVLHTDFNLPLTIGQNVTVGHNATLHGCHVADSCLIGMGATLLNGCRIASECIVAAQALVKENFAVDSRNLLRGVPASCHAGISDNLVAEILANAELYRNLADQHRLLQWQNGDSTFQLKVLLPAVDLEQLTAVLIAAGAVPVVNSASSNLAVELLPAAAKSAPEAALATASDGADCQLELMVSRQCLNAVIQALLTSHPWQRPVFAIRPLNCCGGG